MSTKPLTSTMRRVLLNLAAGRPMWDGVPTINGGGGIPAVAKSLRHRGYIDHSDKLTPAGRKAAEKVKQ
jgi:hypothetical protein